MALSINANTAAFDAARNLQLTSQDFMTAVQRLSSGLRINSAADDPAGLAISQKFLAQANGYDQVQRNLQDSVSLLQTAQSGLNETQTLLQRMNTLAVQASNGTLTSSDLLNIQTEVVGLVSEIDRVAQQTQYNTRTLLNGSTGGAQVSGGGPDIINLTAQAGVAAVGTYTVTANTNATQGFIQGNAPSTATFTGGDSMTITGPTASQTFTTYAGEAVSTFESQVNSANLGVTVATVGGKYQLTNTNYGSATSISTSAAGTGADFGSGAGAAMGLASGAYTAGTNAQVNITSPSSGPSTVTLSGNNSDTFNGSSSAPGTAGVSFKVANPGSISGNDTFTVTQNTALKLTEGPNPGNEVLLAIDAQTSQSLGVTSINMTTQAGGEAAISVIQNAINQVSTAQANLGALQNSLTDNQNLAASQETNFLSARSNLMDANIPQETIRFTRDQILMQAGTAVLAQANQTPAGLLALLATSATGH